MRKRKSTFTAPVRKSSRRRENINDAVEENVPEQEQSVPDVSVSRFSRKIWLTRLIHYFSELTDLGYCTAVGYELPLPTLSNYHFRAVIMAWSKKSKTFVRKTSILSVLFSGI